MAPIQLSRLAFRRTVNLGRPSSPWIQVQSRSITYTTPLTFPRKDSQDKDSINTEATENTKSGTDDQAASNQAAFDPSTTRPGQEKVESEQEKDGDPLDVSAANPDVSKARPPQEGGAQKNASSSGGKSGHVSPPKGKKVN